MYIAKKFSADNGVDESSAVMLVDAWLESHKKKQASVQAELSEKERLSQARAQVKAAISAVTRTLARKSGLLRTDGQWHGMKQKAIHSQYRDKVNVSQSDMTEDQLRAKHTWLEQLHTQIAQSPAVEVPEWLR